VSIMFFGQFLLERGEIDEQQLRAALDLMERENQTIGELAVAEGFATAAECRRVHGEQRRKDLPFGELAVHMGALNNVELEELLQLQRRTRLPLASALVRTDVLTPERARDLYDEFKSEHTETPAKPALPGALVGHRLAEVTSELLSRLLLRVAGIDSRVGSGRELDGLPDGVLIASLPVVGLHGLTVTMQVEGAFGKKLAAGLLGFQLEELAGELALDAVGEFLNVLAGNAVSSLEDEALELQLKPPCYGVLPTQGFVFDIETESDGGAVLILELP
jgi:hypothetical protein